MVILKRIFILLSICLLLSSCATGVKYNIAKFKDNTTIRVPTNVDPKFTDWELLCMPYAISEYAAAVSLMNPATPDPPHAGVTLVVSQVVEDLLLGIIVINQNPFSMEFYWVVDHKDNGEHTYLKLKDADAFDYLIEEYDKSISKKSGGI
jgi:uncharacterized protein YceK